MKSLTHPLYESSVNCLWGLRSFKFSIERSGCIDNVFSFFQLPKIRYFPRVQQIIDILQKQLIHYLIVSKQKRYRRVFIWALPHQSFQKLFKTVQIVSFSNFHLSNFITVVKRWQSGERLLTWTTDPEEKTVASAKTEDSLNSENMLDGFVEED